MEKSKIFEMAIRELTETAINKRKETLEDNELQLYTEVKTLSAQARDIVKMLPEEQQKILTDYFEKTNLIADHDDRLQYRLGQMLYTGTGTDKDVQAAVSYLEKSAQFGNINAQYLLGKVCLETGIGDPAQAIAWMTKAAEVGNAGAQYALGKLYRDGTHGLCSELFTLRISLNTEKEQSIFMGL